MDRRHRIALAIVAASFLAAGLAVAASGLDRHVAIYPPQQLPLTFSHAQHMQGGAECVTCHDPARKSTMAGDWLLPKHPECEDCHDIRGASEGKQVDPPAACSTCHPGFDQTVRQKPAKLEVPTANLRFNHKVHVDRKVECKVCHAGTESVALATRMQLPKMATCLTCHDGRQASAACTTCHLKDGSGRLQTQFLSGLLRPMQGDPLGLDHGPRFEFNHGTRAAVARDSCAQCHSDSYCLTCHDSLQKPLSVHPNDFISLHPVQARGNVTRCESCHRLQSFCIACHERSGVGLDADPSLRGRNVRVHPDYATWVTTPGPAHHGIQASRDIKQCIACHREESCIACHATREMATGRGFAVNPHPNGFARTCRQQASRNDQACLRCHSEPQLQDLGCR
ncbi:MAG TPA: cytochrome c3 family protein [Longimicrobium sp.]|nr:cytochrome c3 family protein [Longimicrobium sp.]